MSEPLLKHETFEYREDEPFLIFNIVPTSVPYERLLNHWHEELEVAYVIKGNSLHYIDGVCIRANPGRLIVTNTESVHNIIPDPETDGLDEIVNVILMIHAQFLEKIYPQIRSVHFLNTGPRRGRKRQISCCGFPGTPSGRNIKSTTSCMPKG